MNSRLTNGYVFSLIAFIAIVLLNSCASTPKDIVLVNIASKAFDSGAYDKCIDDCTRAIEFNRNSYFAYNLRGNCEQIKGLYDQAIADFRKALEIYPGWSVPQSNIKNVLNARQNKLQQQKKTTRQNVPGNISTSSTPTKRTSVQIYSVDVKPERVSPFAEFDIIVKYSVTDPEIKQEEIPVSFVFGINQGQEVLVDSEPVIIYAKNGTPSQRVVHLKASGNKGTYQIKVTMKYKNKGAGESSEIVVE